MVKETRLQTMIKQTEELLDKKTTRESKLKSRGKKMVAVRRCDDATTKMWLLRPRENNRR